MDFGQRGVILRLVEVSSFIRNRIYIVRIKIVENRSYNDRKSMAG